MAAPKKVDYERIEPGWRAGILSPKQLAAQYIEDTGESVSHAAIIKHFRKEGIARDLSGKIRDKAKAMVTEAMVTGKVTAKPSKPDSEIIEETSTQVATVLLRHRKDIAKLSNLTMSLVDQLEKAVSEKDDKKRPPLAELILSGQRSIQSLDRLQQMERVALDLNAGEDAVDIAGATAAAALSDAQRASRMATLIALARRKRDDADV